MSVLRISLFGTVQVAHSNPAIPSGKSTRTIQALLAYLVLERNRLHPRDVLAGLFWAEHDPNRARNCLNTAVWRLRQVLEPAGVAPGTYLLTNHQGDIGFNAESEHWLDVAVFEDTLHSLQNPVPDILTLQQVSEIEEALALYRGDLLEGFYDDWALREREHLHRLYLNGLASLMRHYKRAQSYDRALDCGQRILREDPLREEIHREMMRLYVQGGQRSLALQQYGICRTTLANELGILPMEETRLVYEQLVSDLPVQDQTPPLNTTVELQQALVLCQQVTQTLAVAQRELDQAIHKVELLLHNNH